MFSAAGQSGRLLEEWRNDRFEMATSEFILQEASVTLSDTGLRDKYSLSELVITGYLADVRRFATFPELPEESINVVRDPKDNRIIAAAIACNADVVVTNDKDLLTLREFRGIPFVTASDFLHTLGIHM
jgi:uncharacterized protein